MESPGDVPEKLQRLLEASATLLGSVHLENPYPTILEFVTRLTVADACAIWRTDPQGLVWRIVASVGLSETFTTVAVTSPEGPSPSLQRQKQYEAEGIRGLIAIPMALPEPSALMALYYREVAEFSQEELQFASTAVNTSAAALRSWELLRERERSRVMMEVTVRALRDQEERLKMAMEAGDLGFWEWDETTGRVYCSEHMAAVFGFRPEEFDGSRQAFLSRIHPEDRPTLDQAMILARARRSRFEQEFRISGRDGKEHWIASSARVISDERGRVLRIVGVGVDVTKRRLLENRLREAQKRESVSLLAAGVAHDFNNLLTGIMGNASMARESVGASREARNLLDNVIDASRRAADLTRQLLAYSGHGKYVVTPVSLSGMVRSIQDWIESGIPKRVSLVCEIPENLPLVEADTAQMQQVILNLVINASEAIGDQSGRIVIRTGRVPADLKEGHEEAGVYLEVTDTGCGMNPAIRERIFDPFFTTKFTGRGLGLAAVSGIVHGHGGSIQVSSEPGKGSTFRIVLPAVQDQQSSESAAGNSAA
jgi:PAS domain S-box-containing protein